MSRVAQVKLDGLDLGRIAGAGLLYFVAARFGLSLAFATQQVTAVWPPTGIALAAMLLYGIRMWPGIFLGAFLANLLAHEPVFTAVGIAGGNTLMGVAGTLLLDRVWGFDRALSRVRDVLGIVVLGALAACTVSATNGVIQLAMGRLIPWNAAASVWWVWWAGDAMGVILFAPLLLLWIRDPGLDWRWRQGLELMGLLLATGLVCHLAFSGRWVATSALFRFEYAVFPFVIWVALRFHPRETTLVTVLIAAFTIWGAIHDRGPFAMGTLDQRLILLEVFMAVMSVTGLLLAAATAERKLAERELQQAHDELELRVRDRTEELSRANRDLEEKNEEIEAFVYIVSHDLRAPLVNIQGFTKELQVSCSELETHLGKTELPVAIAAPVARIFAEDMPSALRFISASVTKFQRLIDALLTLSRLGRQVYHSERVDIRAQVGMTLDSLQGLIDQRGAETRVGDLPDAMGDSTAIGQVFGNLIENALKYLQPDRKGRVEIGGDLLDGMAHYWVKDNGSGIPENARNRIFQVFQRFHPNLAAGEGMGLAAMKRMVERHGGRVWWESAAGSGATFHFTLPAWPESTR